MGHGQRKILYHPVQADNNIMKNAKINKINWVYEWERQMNYFNGYWVTQVWTQKFPKSYKIIFNWRRRSNYLLLAKNHDAFAYVDLDEVNKTSADYLKLTEQKNYLKLFQKKASLYFVNIEKIINQIKNNKIKLLSDYKIADLLESFYLNFIKNCGLVADIRYCNWMGDIFLKNILRQKTKDQLMVDEYASILMISPKKSLFFKMEEDFLKLLIAINKNPKSRVKQIEKFTEKYKWTAAGFNNEADLIKADTEFKVAKNLNRIKLIKNEIRAKIKFYKAEIRKRNNLLKKLKLRERQKNLLNFLAWGIYYKDYLRAMQNKWFLSKERIFMKEIGRCLKISEGDMFYLSVYEIIGALRGKKINLTVIKKRRRAYAFVVINNSLRIYDGVQAKKFINDFNDFEKKLIKKEVVQEIKGMVASRGILRGQVMTFNKFDGKTPGYFDNKIIVISMTTPDIMPYIKKVKAIITDEGGVTCHAAIISRELGIPCIIGTRVATKILKDGDLVEVDADKGIVKIIKKAS